MLLLRLVLLRVSQIALRLPRRGASPASGRGCSPCLTTGTVVHRLSRRGGSSVFGLGGSPCLTTWTAKGRRRLAPRRPPADLAQQVWLGGVTRLALVTPCFSALQGATPCWRASPHTSLSVTVAAQTFPWVLPLIIAVTVSTTSALHVSACKVMRLALQAQQARKPMQVLPLLLPRRRGRLTLAPPLSLGAAIWT